ncbi:MAG: DUF2868 domain-containing protein [Alphaproteobacteria bacterium]|nr:DUF2868 domain-containing protein [Alphaproteobacteria bacterium]
MTPPGENSSADRERFEGRIIAEAVRVLEGSQGHAFDDAAAEAEAKALAGDLEDKIILRARRLGPASQLVDTLNRIRIATKIATVIGALIALAAGAATARAALSAESGAPVNFHWAVLALLGVETVTLVLWLIMASLSSRATASFSLGGAISAVGRRMAGWLHRDAASVAMIRAVAAIMSQGAIARWTLGIVTHALWLSFVAGALAMTLLILSAKQVTFAWQTTILSEATYIPVTEALAVLPRAAGFVTPTAEQIHDSRWTGAESPATNASGAWAGLLVGALVVYGLAPRVLLLLVCLFARVRAATRFRLDLRHPEYARLEERLMPSVRHGGIVDQDQALFDHTAVSPAEIQTIEFSGAIAVVGLELERSGTDEARAVPGDAWHDLGNVDNREDAEKALSAVTELAPGLVLVAASSLTTPDRGVAAFLANVGRAVTGPLAILLSDGGRLRSRYGSSDADERLEDWRRLAQRTGIPGAWVIEYELSAPSKDDRARLARLLGTDTP